MHASSFTCNRVCIAWIQACMSACHVCVPCVRACFSVDSLAHVCVFRCAHNVHCACIHLRATCNRLVAIKARKSTTVIYSISTRRWSLFWRCWLARHWSRRSWRCMKTWSCRAFARDRCAAAISCDVHAASLYSQFSSLLSCLFLSGGVCFTHIGRTHRSLVFLAVCSD